MQIVNPGLSEDYKAFKKRYSNYPFGDTTIDAGTSLIDRIMEEKKRWAPNDTAYK